MRELTQYCLAGEPGHPGQLHWDVVNQHLLLTHRDVQLDLQESLYQHNNNIIIVVVVVICPVSLSSSAHALTAQPGVLIFCRELTCK